MTVSRFALVAVLALVAPASAQSFATPDRESPLAVTDISRQAAGGAVAALPTVDSPFLANPAHVTEDGVVVNILGVTAGVGGNVRESYSFYADDLGPAIESGLDAMRASDPARLQALYAEALRIGSQPKTADLAVLAPSVRIAAGPFSVGAGLFGHSVTRARITDGGAGIPFVDLYSQADVAVPVVAGVDLAKTPAGAVLPFGVQLGARATFLQRRVTAKAEPIDAIEPDGEKLYVLSGDAVRLAVGAFLRDVAVPGLDLGAEVSNVGSAIDYDLDRSFEVSGSGGTADDMREVAALEARFDGRQAEPVVRLGGAFRLPAVPGVREAAVALDYTSASTASADQSLQAGLRLGARATLGGVLRLQAGVSQGMPSAGVGISTRVARIEYATYGVEDGRLLGQLQRRNHVVLVRFGWF